MFSTNLHYYYYPAVLNIFGQNASQYVRRTYCLTNLGNGFSFLGYFQFSGGKEEYFEDVYCCPMRQKFLQQLIQTHLDLNLAHIG